MQRQREQGRARRAHGPYVLAPARAKVRFSCSKGRVDVEARGPQKTNPYRVLTRPRSEWYRAPMKREILLSGLLVLAACGGQSSNTEPQTPATPPTTTSAVGKVKTADPPPAQIGR